MDGGALDVVVCGGGPGWGNGCMSAGGNRLKAAGGTLGGGGIGRTGGDVAIGVPFLKLNVVVNMVVVVAQWAASLGLQRLVVIDICWPTRHFLLLR